ncbi:hypothetical protein AJ85_12270 [Alkalihalobacillus alcalophilus ATCC 27647 = CGMCC 1.3604]|uniref:DUF4440 domain-containing protein n=1 Tax=Alkalihalobacillus alcalophilus ATCC 27647 = CGMCC 1.3604 TaxID=1218173 RepID=A0A094YS93_ALKAL|nr:hypothetical protein [Alkalihalobacillus alcalophilus]KGA96347.1 hypothetical protein BALCAV_0216670 [Alkalihalobacillus alcalophilus ATCC 27647 = CGMCC 1.3604]MED1563842.1 hypothetical protein [Alkalihalobacillus alcalophilus]THG90169.1 hypothetical protein AJ85_12270 [Alkalihalobacillus alcalophilus ATCC 27647 = CGMCC 1.3604]
MNDLTKATIEAAEQWMDMSNKQNLKGLSEVTAKEIEIIGPKGKGLFSHEELGEWMKRANLQLATKNRFVKGSTIVLEQHGTWLESDRSIKGEAIVYTVMRVKERLVQSLARFDNKEQAFDYSGLKESNKLDC